MKSKILLIIAFLFTSFFLLSGCAPPASKYPKHTVKELEKQVQPVSDLEEGETKVPGKQYEGLTDKESKDYNEKIEAMRACEKDRDCVGAYDGPCTCARGGGQIAINRKNTAEFKELHKQTFGHPECKPGQSDDLTCVAATSCVESRCVMDTEHPEFCGRASMPNRCYYGFALKLKDPELCDKQQAEKYGYDRKGCFENLAVSMDDVSLCDKLEDAEQTDCRNHYYDQAARGKKEYGLCSDIGDGELQQDCLFDVVTSGDREKDCEQIEDKDQQDLCISTIIFNRAHEKKDPEICYDIPVIRGINPSQESCLNRVGPYTGNPDYCVPDGNDPALYPSCMKRNALMNGDYKLCNKITSGARESYVYNCITDTLIGGKVDYKDAILACRTLSDEKDRKRTCLWEISIHFLNTTFCSETYDPEGCQKTIEKELLTEKGQKRLKELKE